MPYRAIGSCYLLLYLKRQIFLPYIIHLIFFFQVDGREVIFGHILLPVVHHSIPLHLLILQVYVFYVHASVIVVVSEGDLHNFLRKQLVLR